MSKVTVSCSPDMPCTCSSTGDTVCLYASLERDLDQGIWKVPLPSGEARRLGTLEGQDASFFPDGRVIFVTGADIYVADKDGSNPHKLLTTPGTAGCPRVSFDGRRILFVNYLPQQKALVLAEAAADGSGYHEIARGTESSQIHCSYWSFDGKWLFTRFGSDIWLLPASDQLLARNRRPIQLTHGPLNYSSLSPSRDGQRLFAFGAKQRGELVRYDANSKQFVPMLPADEVAKAISGQFQENPATRLLAKILPPAPLRQ